MTKRVLLAAGLSLFLVACSEPTVLERVGAVQAALTSGDFASAQSSAEELLRGNEVLADSALAWRVQKLHLDALVGNRRAADVVATLDALPGDAGAHVDAALYARLARGLGSAGDTPGAVAVIEAGVKRYPEHEEDFADVVLDLQTAANPGDPGSEALSQVSYLTGRKRQHAEPTPDKP